MSYDNLNVPDDYHPGYLLSPFADFGKPFHRQECRCDACENWLRDNMPGYAKLSQHAVARSGYDDARQFWQAYEQRQHSSRAALRALRRGAAKRKASES